MLSRCIGCLWVQGVSCGGLRCGGKVVLIPPTRPGIRTCASGTPQKRRHTRPSLRDQRNKARQERCQGSGDGSGGLLLPGPAVEDTLPAWLGERHAVPGCVAGRDRVGKRADQGTVGRRGWHESHPVGQKGARVEGIGAGAPRAERQAVIIRSSCCQAFDVFIRVLLNGVCICYASNPGPGTELLQTDELAQGGKRCQDPFSL